MKKIIYLIATLSISVAMHGQKSEPLRFNSEGKFKIVQFTDIHYNPQPDGTGDYDVEAMLSKVIEAEKPDLAVFTGDIVGGRPQKDGWNTVLKAVIDRKIPYAVVIGNHDDEGDWKRPQIAEYLSHLPYSLFTSGLETLKGYGNYTLDVLGNDGKPAAILYFMDSNAYAKLDGHHGSGYFAFNQVEWYRETSRELTKNNGGLPYPALAFFHIPLQEYAAMHDTTRIYFKRTDRTVTGDRKEPECPGVLNTGMFAAMAEAGDVMGTFVGHDHVNNYIGCYGGIALAYGCYSGSYSRLLQYRKMLAEAYAHTSFKYPDVQAKEGTMPGVGGRVIELHENRRSFDTWLRLADGDTLYRVNYPNTFNIK
ncbi:MAG: metallophosphoesterase family protein [Prevotellaceae bacterium]|jgi:hypothetical protein|nr:metallophosphoesterase family protein [Prevotellaceae bacterium]